MGLLDYGPSRLMIPGFKALNVQSSIPLVTIDEFVGVDGSSINTSTIWDKTTNPTPLLSIQNNSAFFTSGTNGGYTALDAIQIRTKNTYLEPEVLFSEYEFTMINEEMDVDLGFKGSGYIDWYMAGSENGYTVHIRPYEHSLRLQRSISESWTILDSCSFTDAVGHNPIVGEKWDFSIRHTGTELQVFIWESGNSKPTTPCLSSNDTTYTGSGKISIGGGNGASGARTWKVGGVFVSN